MGQKSKVVKVISLLPWFELVGIYEDLYVKDGYVHLTISNKTLSFPEDSVEAKEVQESLDDVLVGRKIAVLRTDIHEKPIRIRLVN